jgi:hypothetical protein
MKKQNNAQRHDQGQYPTINHFFYPPQFSLDITFKYVLVFSSIPTSLAGNPPLFPSAYVQRSSPVSPLAVQYSVYIFIFHVHLPCSISTCSVLFTLASLQCELKFSIFYTVCNFPTAPKFDAI